MVLANTNLMVRAKKNGLIRSPFEARCPLEFSDPLKERAPNFVKRVQQERKESRCLAKVAWDRALMFHERGWWKE